jgi:hypothetical protein
MSLSAMKQALEALERGRSQIIGALVQQDQDEAITALRQAIAEAEKQEPVVGTKTWFEDGKMVTQHLYASDISQERVDETAKHGHEPVAWREVTGKTTHYYDYNEDGRGEPLYLHREWVGLTGEEKIAIYKEVDGRPIDLMDAIEAKLKKKNIPSESFIASESFK